MSYWGAIGAGALSLLGGISKYQQGQHNVQQGQRFSMMMRSTAYQTAVADMKAAGLNPILAAGGGGSTGFGVPPADTSDVLSPAVSSGLQAARLEADIELARSQAEKASSDVEVNREIEKRVAAETDQVKVSTALDSAALPRAKNLERVEEGRFGKVMSYVDRLMGALGLGSKVLRSK